MFTYVVKPLWHTTQLINNLLKKVRSVEEYHPLEFSGVIETVQDVDLVKDVQLVHDEVCIEARRLFECWW
jgi:hypothetical protein